MPLPLYSTINISGNTRKTNYILRICFVANYNKTSMFWPLKMGKYQMMFIIISCIDQEWHWTLQWDAGYYTGSCQMDCWCWGAPGAYNLTEWSGWIMKMMMWVQMWVNANDWVSLADHPTCRSSEASWIPIANRWSLSHPDLQPMVLEPAPNVEIRMM